MYDSNVCGDGSRRQRLHARQILWTTLVAEHTAIGFRS